MKRLTKVFALKCHALKSCGRAGSAFFVVLLAAVGRLAKNDEMYEFPPISSSGWYLTLFLTVRVSSIYHKVPTPLFWARFSCTPGNAHNFDQGYSSYGM